MDPNVLLDEKTKKETESLRSQLSALRVKGKIKVSQRVLDKCKLEHLKQIYESYQIERTKKATKFILKSMVKVASRLLRNRNLIEDAKWLENDLKENKLLVEDVESLASKGLQRVPFPGLCMGEITVATHVTAHKMPEGIGEAMSVIQEEEEEEIQEAQEGSKVEEQPLPSQQ